MEFDEILKRYIGEFGRYQKLQFVLVCLPTIFTAMHSLSWTFTGASIPYRCLLAEENETFPFIPSSHNYSQWLYGGDSRKKIAKEHHCVRIANFSVSSVQFPYGDDIDTEPCKDGFRWDTSEISNSALKNWEMVCDKQWLKSFVQSMYYVGQFFGSFVFGVLADRFGRKNIFFVAIVTQIVCGIAMAYVPYWPLFALFRFGVGFSHPGIFVIAVVIGIELVGPSRRVLSSVGAGIFFAIGEIILGSLAYGIRDYQHLQLAISLPALIFITYWWIVPESARWLISRKRFNEAGEILSKAARMNKRTLPENWYNDLEIESKSDSTKENKKKYGWTDLFRTPNIRKRSLICFVCWPTVSMAYYGLAMNPNFLGGDAYLAFIVGGVLEIIAILIVLLTMNIVGRKILCSGGFLFAALCLLLTLAVPDEMETMKMILVIVGKMSLTGVYAVVYVITPELYPTTIRTTAMGICSMIARVGATSASYIALWLAEVSPVAVVLIFGSLCIIAGTLAVFLPETTGHPQLETMEEAESFGEQQPLFYLVWKKNENKNVESKL